MRWIGIDFGTTNSAAGRLEQGRPVETLGGPMRNLPHPSTVAWNQGRHSFGFDAQRAALDDRDPSLIITGLKYHLGRTPAVRVDRETFDAEELTARYLKFLMGQLFGATSIPDRVGAVIATPVEFPPSHRHALRRAAVAAGIAAAEFVYEPTAALYSALDGRDFPQGPVAVIDWGGGTVDITLVRCHRRPDRIEDLNVNARSTGLGGRDLDRLILQRLLVNNPAGQTWFDGASRSRQNSVLSRLERGKIDYLTSGALKKTNIDFSIPEMPEQLYPAFRLSETVIGECVDRFVCEIRRLAIETTRTAGLAVEDVTDYLLVGGPVQSLRVQRGLEGIWPRAKALAVGSRQLATVRGAALLADRGFDLVLATNIAVRQHDDQLHHVLRRGQPFPRKGEARYREYRYRLTDLTAESAVLEIGHVPDGGSYMPLETLSVPVMHHRDDHYRRVIPYEVPLRIGLDEHLYVTAVATGRVQNERGTGTRDIPHKVELSRIPLDLRPGERGARR